MRIGGFKYQSRSPVSRVVGSALVHGAAICLLIYAGHSYVAPMLMPGDANGTRMTLTYMPGRAPEAVSARALETKTPPVENTEAKITAPALAAPARESAKVPNAQSATSSQSTNTSASPNPNASTGADSLGTGNINIAYLDSFRSPRPDLSSLPRGISGDVVLDVTIDTAGRIIALKKLSGVGYGIDESVIATVQAWVFHPATRDGAPVVSEQELHFHYERNG